MFIYPHDLFLREKYRLFEVLIYTVRGGVCGWQNRRILSIGSAGVVHPAPCTENDPGGREEEVEEADAPFKDSDLQPETSAAIPLHQTSK